MVTGIRRTKVAMIAKNEALRLSPINTKAITNTATLVATPSP